MGTCFVLCLGLQLRTSASFLDGGRHLHRSKSLGKRLKSAQWSPPLIVMQVYAYGIVNIILDFLVWLTPIPLIWQLQLGLHQRVALTFVFTLGLA